MLPALLPLLIAAAPADISQGDFKEQHREWQQERSTRLRAPDGWLTLVNLAWLEEGENKAGSAKGSTIELPKGAPKLLGTFVREGNTVRFTPAKGVEVTVDGKRFEGGAVQTDADGAPDVLQHKTLSLIVIQRGERLGVRVRDTVAPTRTRFSGIPFFDPSLAWRKVATWEPAKEGETLQIPNVLGDASAAPLAGTAVFTHEGRTYRLQATEEGDRLFFVFGDLTNRDTTYGAGRFLYTALPEDGRLVLDFNRAYNPPCAFTAYATCPLPPKQNKLGLRIEAGEKRYGK